MYGGIICPPFGHFVFLHPFVTRLAIRKGMAFYIAETDENNWMARQLR